MALLISAFEVQTDLSAAAVRLGKGGEWGECGAMRLVPLPALGCWDGALRLRPPALTKAGKTAAVTLWLLIFWFMLKLTKRPSVQLCAAAAAVPIWPGPVRSHLPNSNCLLPIVQCVRIKQRRFDSATLVVVYTQYPRGQKDITGPVSTWISL